MLHSMVILLFFNIISFEYNMIIEYFIAQKYKNFIYKYKYWSVDNQKFCL